jgi:predicted dehydrogenase
MAAVHVEAVVGAGGGEVVAVASRSGEQARSFAVAQGIERPIEGYEALIAAEGIDAVYVATTNDFHHDQVLACAAAGKAILCEKPLALNAAQAEAMIRATRAAGVFFMEAMWMRFQPFMPVLETLLAEGRIGPITHLSGAIGFVADQDRDRRWLNRGMGGGAILDIGVYPMTLAHLLLGPPEEMEVTAILADTGVDEQVGVVSRHRDGAMSVITATLAADTGVEATISGPEGRIRLHNPFLEAPLVTLHRDGDLVESFDTSYEGNGWRFQVEEAHRCLAEGRIESQLRPLDDTLAVMRWMDEVRRRAGVRYPGE